MVIAGCGGGVSIDELDDALRDAVCDRFLRCGIVESREACDALADVSETAVLELQHGVDNGTIDYDESAMQDCLDAFGDASCDETAESARVDPPACDKAIKGTIADGGSCMINAQCISGDCDNANCPDACCAGVCVPGFTPAAIGQPCPIGFECEDRAFCDTSNICQPLLAADSPCTSDGQCGFGLYCPSATDRCTDAPNLGDPCPDRDCADLGARCDATNICVALARRGEACATLGSCMAPNVCNAATMICEPPPGLGQPCTGACAIGTYCDQQSNTCAAAKADGQPCDLNRECAAGNCNDMSICGTDPVCI